MEFVPDTEMIKRTLDMFLVRADQVEGIYGNEDVDSMIFKYRTSVQSESELRGALSIAIEGSEWRETSAGGEFLEYRRTLRRSFEVVRLSFLEPTRTVVVAYVQADGSRNDVAFEDTGESRWAAKNIWPRFHDLVEKEQCPLTEGG
jgi:hypothetical protein